MNIFYKKKQKPILVFLFLAILIFHFHFLGDIIGIYANPTNIFPTSFIVLIVNSILFLIVTIMGKNCHNTHLVFFVLFFNIYISFIEPFRICKTQIIIEDYKIGFYNLFLVMLEVLKHISYIFSAKAFHVAYVLSAYHKQNKTLKKSICLLLLQFIPLIGTLAITIELFYDHTIDKRIVLVFCFISVLFFIVSVYVLFYIGYMIHSF